MPLVTLLDPEYDVKRSVQKAAIKNLLVEHGGSMERDELVNKLQEIYVASGWTHKGQAKGILSFYLGKKFSGFLHAEKPEPRVKEPKEKKSKKKKEATEEMVAA